MNSRRLLVSGVAVPLFIALSVLLNFASRPGFDTIRAVDAIRLIAVGMCFGVAVVSLVTFLRGSRP
jgi:hypothetical protein